MNRKRKEAREEKVPDFFFEFRYVSVTSTAGISLALMEPV